MKRVLSLVLVICLLSSVSGNVMADDIYRTSSYADADSYSEMQFLFQNFNEEAVYTDGKVTTAMIMTAIGRYFQIDVTSTQNTYYEAYPEFIYDSWYSPYMIWAYEIGVLSDLQPGYKLTRSELATLLWIVTDKLASSLPEINAAYPFMDTDTFINGLDAATKLQMSGIILEKQDGSYGPNELVTVSEAQGILLRFLPNLKAEFNMRQIPTSTVTASAPVDDSWFDDSLFIGHSQVAGMSHYFNLPNIEYFCIIGHTAQEALDYPWYELSNGRMGPLREGLELDPYGKVYIMLGINDCTSREDQLERFITPMKQIIEMVQETQPDAKIYLLSLAPVGRNTPNNFCYSLDNVVLFTQTVKSLAREYNTEYIDVFRLMCDEYGYIRDEFNAGDGIHIDAHHYDEILYFLKCHT